MKRKMCLALVFVSLSGAAKAHDWYPLDCCHGMDCAPAISVQQEVGGLWVTTSRGTAFFPTSMLRRSSPDHQTHACMRPAFGGKMTPVCLFLPPNS